MSKKKIEISTPIEIDIHSSSVIRPAGGEKAPIDEIKSKGKLKAIGVKDSGWHLPGSEFHEGKAHKGFELPAFSDRRGAWKRVLAVLDDNPRVYKILLPHQASEHVPTSKEDREIAERLHEKVPAAKILDSFQLPVHLSDAPDKPLTVEVHEFVGPKRTGSKLIEPKNLWEERIEDVDEAADILSQISDTVTSLFGKHDVLYTDTKLDNFARDSEGRVKLVDLDAEKRTHSEEETKWLGKALARPVNQLLDRNPHLSSLGIREKRKLKKTIRNNIKKNIRRKDKAKKVGKSFEEELDFRKRKEKRI